MAFIFKYDTIQPSSFRRHPWNLNSSRARFSKTKRVCYFTLVNFRGRKKIRNPPPNHRNFKVGEDHSHQKKHFLVFTLNLVVSNLCPSPPVLSAGTAEKSLAPFSSTPLNRHLQTSIRFPPHTLPSLLFSRTKVPQHVFIWKTFRSLNHLCGPLLDLLQEVHAFLLLRRTGHSTPGVATTSAEHSGKITSLDLLTMLFLVQPRMPMTSLFRRLVLGSRSPPCPLQAMLLSIQQPHSTVLLQSALSPEAQDFIHCQR